MTKARIFISLLSILCFSQPALSQRSQTGGGKTDVYIYVEFEDQSPAAQAYKVQLLSSTRLQVAMDFTNDRGQAIFRGLSAGDYRAAVTGPDIELTEISFTVESHGQPFDFSQNEHIQVRKLKSDTPTSPGGTISTGALKIPDSARKEFEKGLEGFDKHDIGSAREHFEKAVELYPQYCGALVNLGVIAAQQGHLDEGKNYFQRAVKADPQNPAAYVYLASALMLAKDYKGAEPLLLKATAIVPLDPEPLTMLASSQLEQGELKEAVSSAKKVHSLKHEGHAIAHYIAAQALMKESQPADAAEEYRLFLKEAPNAPQASKAKAALDSIAHTK